MKRTLTLSIAALFALAACDGGMMMNPDVPDTTCSMMPEAVTMVSLQTDIFETKCKTCHYPDPDGAGPMQPGSGFSYGDYTDAMKTFEMVNKTSLFAGSPGTLKIVDQMAATTSAKLANSSLWLKVSTLKPLGFKGPKMESSGVRMPNDGSAFTAAEIKKIKDWICRGSPMM